MNLDRFAIMLQRDRAAARPLETRRQGRAHPDPAPDSNKNGSARDAPTTH